MQNLNLSRNFTVTKKHLDINDHFVAAIFSNQSSRVDQLICIYTGQGASCSAIWRPFVKLVPVFSRFKATPNKRSIWQRCCFGQAGENLYMQPTMDLACLPSTPSEQRHRLPISYRPLYSLHRTSFGITLHKFSAGVKCASALWA